MNQTTTVANKACRHYTREPAIGHLRSACAPALGRRPGALTRLGLATLLCVGTIPLPAQAQEQRLQLSSAMLESIQQMVTRSVAGKGRVEIKVGELDPRLQLAPCLRAEPVLLPGTRFWGRSQITIRCVEGAHWSILLPITVSVFGEALVARGNLPIGTLPQAGDFEVTSIDLTRENAAWVTDAAQLAGRVLARPLQMGQALRADHLKIAATVQQGDQVKVRVPGQGFTITTDALAMASAGPGQSLRLRTESGKVVSGTVRDGFVEVKP